MWRENPVFWYHLLGQSRARWYRQRALTVILGGLGLLLYFYLLVQTIRYELDPAIVLILGLLLLCLLTPLGCYALFSMEYEKATWESLAITRLTVDEIVFGKWFSRVLGVLVIVLLLTPIAYIAWVKYMYRPVPFIGWLSAIWMLTAWGVLLVSIGMWLSLRLRHSIASAATLYGVQVFTLLFLPLLTMILLEMATQRGGDMSLTEGMEQGASTWQKLLFWLEMPFDWRCIFWLNPFAALAAVYPDPTNYYLLLQAYGFGWGQGVYYLLFSGLFYLLTRQGVRHHWRK